MRSYFGIFIIILFHVWDVISILLLNLEIISIVILVWGLDLILQVLFVHLVALLSSWCPSGSLDLCCRNQLCIVFLYDYTDAHKKSLDLYYLYHTWLFILVVPSDGVYHELLTFWVYFELIYTSIELNIISKIIFCEHYTLIWSINIHEKH